jgi:hypothetical protein
MRVYEVKSICEKHIIEADEIKFRSDFFHETKKEPLVFFREGRLHAIFKEWETLRDITEKSVEQKNEIT